MTPFARFRAWLVSSVVAPEFLSIEVDITLDEEDLFDAPTESTTRIKVSGTRARALEPSRSGILELVECDEEDEVTRRIDVRELRRTLKEAGRRRHG